MRETQGYFFEYFIPYFLRKYKYRQLLSLNKFNGTYSTSTDISHRKTMLGMIGETYEREAMILYNKVCSQKNINPVCMDMLSKKILNFEEINNPYLYLYFLDSCGMASFTNSYNCIENSLAEFIERQAFMLSYLSKSKPKILMKDKNFLMLIPKEFHFIDFFDISIIENYKVYFALGVKDSVVYCALGAAYTSEEALQKLIKELYISSNRHGSIKVKHGEKMDYLHLFHMLSIEQIINAYSYLKEGDYCTFKKTKKYSRDEIINELYNNYGMRPMLMSLYHPHYSHSILKYAKNVKIFAFNWFPSFKISSIPTFIFDNIEESAGVKLSRETNFIPFP